MTTTKKFNEFPAIPSVNMRDVAKCIQDVPHVSHSDFIFCQYISDKFDVGGSITYHDYLELSYLYDTYLGNVCLVELR
jgi:hypothetical protein